MVAFVSTATTASVGAMGAGIKTMQRLIKCLQCNTKH